MEVNLGSKSALGFHFRLFRAPRVFESVSKNDAFTSTVPLRRKCVGCDLPSGLCHSQAQVIKKEPVCWVYSPTSTLATVLAASRYKLQGRRILSCTTGR